MPYCDLIKEILKFPPEVDFKDIEKLLVSFDWVLKRQKGSHCIFKSPDHPLLLTIPKVKGKRVKTTYLKQINKILDLKDYYEQNC